MQRPRADGRTILILILTARGSWQEKVLGLEADVDDYLVKPFQFPELAARIKAQDGDSNVLKVLIGRLRCKLDPDGSLAPIETLRKPACHCQVPAPTPASSRPTCSRNGGRRLPCMSPPFQRSVAVGQWRHDTFTAGGDT